MTHNAQPAAEWSDWQPDVLGEGYEQSSLSLGVDPEGEGEIFCTLVRHVPAGTGKHTGAVLYLHGYTDYFFQRHLAEHFARLGYAFYAIDLRKCGRSHRPAQTPHYVSDLTRYDIELNAALAQVRSDAGADVVLMAHSTGGLILPLWVDRLRRSGDLDGISGLILNSPWFDLQGPAFVRNIGTTIIHAIGRVRGLSALPAKGIDTYGASLHVSAKGEWEYDLDWKPLTGFPVRFGWLRAIRVGHQRLHRGLDVGVPALILRSKLTRFSREYGPEVDVADAVLDVKQIQRWAGCLGERTTVVPVENARHDVFLSAPEPRAKAFEELDLWLAWLHAHRSTESAAQQPHVAG